MAVKYFVQHLAQSKDSTNYIFYHYDTFFQSELILCVLYIYTYINVGKQLVLSFLLVIHGDIMICTCVIFKYQKLKTQWRQQQQAQRDGKAEKGFQF